MYNTIVQSQLLNLKNTQRELDVSSQRLVTGKKITKPSDDPVIWDISEKFLRKSKELESFNRNIDIVSTNLSRTKTTIDYVRKNVDQLNGHLELLKTASPTEKDEIIKRYNETLQRIDSETSGNNDINIRKILGNSDYQQSFYSGENYRTNIPYLPSSSTSLGLKRLDNLSDINDIEQQIYDAKNIITGHETKLSWSQSELDTKKKYNEELNKTSMNGYHTLTDADLNEEAALVKSLEIQHALGIQTIGVVNNLRQQLLKILG